MTIFNLADHQARGVGRYDITDGGIVVPAGHNHGILTINRDAWTSRGPGGQVQHWDVDDDDRVQYSVSRLDTEVIHALVFASPDDGATWEPRGYCGATGGVAAGPPILGINLPDDPRADNWLLKIFLLLGEGLTLSAELETLQRIFNADRTPTPRASIAFDDVASGSAQNVTSVSTSGSLDASGSNYLAGFANAFHASSTPTTSSFTWNSENPDTVKVDNESYSSNGNIYGAEWDDFTQATATASATFTDAGSQRIYIHVCAFSGVDTTTPSDSPTSGENYFEDDPIDHQVAKGDDGDWRICTFVGGYGSITALTAGTGEVLRADEYQGANEFVSTSGVLTKSDDGTDDCNFSVDDDLANFGAAVGWNINMGASDPALDQVSDRYYFDDGGHPS